MFSNLHFFEMAMMFFASEAMREAYRVIPAGVCEGRRYVDDFFDGMG